MCSDDDYTPIMLSPKVFYIYFSIYVQLICEAVSVTIAKLVHWSYDLSTGYKWTFSIVRKTWNVKFSVLNRNIHEKNQEFYYNAHWNFYKILINYTNNDMDINKSVFNNLDMFKLFN